MTDNRKAALLAATVAVAIIGGRAYIEMYHDSRSAARVRRLTLFSKQERAQYLTCDTWGAKSRE
uniref:Uncharacterized protein n=1 Tax=Romanomermis culicivorax TaxID=13658 RepID=A0A915IF35_ROMCU